MKSRLLELRDWIWSYLAYAYFTTPLPLPAPHYLRPAIKVAKSWFYQMRVEAYRHQQPRPYVLHYFAGQSSNRKKILLAHGWMSCSLYMTKLIHDLTRAGFEVYALDFPAHGEAGGVQVTWNEAVAVLADVNKRYGRFDAALGHSFGGIMLLHLVSFADQLAAFSSDLLPEKMILISAPTRMRTPMIRVARHLGLSRGAFNNLCDLLQAKAKIDLTKFNLKQFIAKQSKIPFLCIHGGKDETIPAEESVVFCAQYPYATLRLFPHLDHINVVLDNSVSNMILDYLAGPVREELETLPEKRAV